MSSDIRNMARAARYGLPFGFANNISKMEWTCDKCYRKEKSGSLYVSVGGHSFCVRCARLLKQKKWMKIIERHVSSFIGVITVQWEKCREISWTVILAALALAAVTGVSILVYEAINWIGVPDTSITYGVLTDVTPAGNGKVDEIIETPLGDDVWHDTDRDTWEVKGEKVKVIYKRSRLSHEFSASEIWDEGR